MQRAGMLMVVVLLGLMIGSGLMTGPVHAAEDAAASKEAAKDTHKGGPEIFVPVRIDLGIWTMVVFLILFFVLKKYAFAPMIEGLNKREATIQGALTEAQRTRDEAQRLRDQLKGEIDNAHLKVKDIMDDARKDAERTTQEMIAKARTDIQSERDRLRREIETARDQALHQIWNQTAQLATIVSEKAIRRKLNEEDHRRLVDEALAELHDAGTERERQVASVRA